MRLLAIGVDGLSFRVISPWVEEGALPRIASLMRKGSHGVLESTMPPLTPPAWYASLTGVNPGRQNIFGFFRAPRERYAKEPVAASDLRFPALWDHLGAEGKSSAVLYLPMSYPPRAIKGIMVSGFMTPEGAADWASPPELAREITSAVPSFRLNLDHSAIRQGRLRDFYQEALEVLVGQTQAAVHLMRRREWDFFFVHLHDVDSATHLLWKDQDPAHPGYRRGNRREGWLRNYYRAVDEAVGRLVEAAGPEAAVLLWSDHGFQPAYRFFSVNGWLARHGYLHLRGRGGLGLKSALSRAGLGREKLRLWAGRLGLAGLVRRLPRGVKEAVPQTRFSFNDLAAHVDWGRSRAYMLSASEGSLYANVTGREPSGSVARGEAPALIREIREGLLEAVDPGTGQRALAGAWTREELYHGPHAEASPDLVLLPADGYYLSENAFDPLFGDQGLEAHQISATHHPEGVVIASGGPFASRRETLRGRIWDVAPTVLRALDCPVPRGLDGHPLEEMFQPEFLEAHPCRWKDAPGEPGPGQGPPPEEMRDIIGQLEGLGYF